MIKHRSKLIALHGLALAACIVVARPVASAAIPAAPTGLSAAPGNGLVTLSWSPSSGATSYNVFRAATRGGSYTLVGTPTSAAYVDKSVTNGTTYYYVVC